MSEQQFGRVWEIFQEATNPKKTTRSSIQLNEVFTVLIELGVGTWSKLPAEMRRGLFKKRKHDQQEHFQRQLEGRVATLGERFKLDDRLALAVPSIVKTELRMQKQRTGVTMSAQVRRRLESTQMRD
jgi:hypothetical protein